MKFMSCYSDLKLIYDKNWVHIHVFIEFLVNFLIHIQDFDKTYCVPVRVSICCTLDPPLNSIGPTESNISDTGHKYIYIYVSKSLKY